MFFNDLAIKLDNIIDKFTTIYDNKHLSPVRKIEKLAPTARGKYCAFVFTNGPTSTMQNPKIDDRGITEAILDTLKIYEAKATFNIIGSTANNYPDTIGELGKFTWNGNHYEHFPAFNEDEKAGAIHQNSLIKRIINEKHEIANHSYSSKLFGKLQAPYNTRFYHKTLDEVVEDLSKLDQYIENDFNYKIKLATPPSDITKIPDGQNIYDAYHQLDYNYLKPTLDLTKLPLAENYEKEVEKLVDAIKNPLAEDEKSLSGQIIVLNDGYNQNQQSPVVEALKTQLELLTNAGYKLVTVSELIHLAPFEDVNANTIGYAEILELLAKNHVIGYRNNTYKPHKKITQDEVAIMLTSPKAFQREMPITYQKMLEIARRNVVVFDLEGVVNKCMGKNRGEAAIIIAENVK